MAEDMTVRCAIAGGGPAGIMLGYLLARAGIEVAVCEKWPDFFRDFRGDTIHPSTMEILHELGLLEGFLKLPHNEMTRMTVHFGAEEATLADFNGLVARCPFVAFLPQWDFLNFIAEKAKAFPAFHLLMQTEVTDIVQENGSVVGIRARGTDGEYTIRADLVVGADGRHSTVREKGGFVVEELGAPIDVLWFRIARSDADDQQSLGYLDQGGGLVMLDRHDYWQCAYIIRKDAFAGIKERGIDAFRESIARLSRLPIAAIAEVDSWDKVKLLSVSVDHVREWAKAGIVVIGDAAHAMSPIGGVGINYAIQDAVAAANILIPVFRHGTPPLSVLEQIQTRRERPVRRMQRMQVFIQNHLLAPVLESSKPLKTPWLIHIFGLFPRLRRIPARVIGIGFQPEHVLEV